MHEDNRVYKIIDHENLIKDGATQAILNTDLSAVARHEKLLAQVNKELKTEEDIRKLQEDMGEIKDMLKALLGRG